LQPRLTAGYTRPAPPPEPRYIEVGEEDIRERGRWEGMGKSREQGGIFQGGNVFGETRNEGGGKMLQGNFNVGGNMSF
jgi:hypothetical protein